MEFVIASRTALSRCRAGKWKALILWELEGGSLRFGELKRRVLGVSEKMLIQQLRELERDQFITRHAFPEVPPRV